MHVCTPSCVAMATSEVRKQHPKGSCPHEDQARLLALRSAHHRCSLWRIPRQIFTALLPPPHPPAALLCLHARLPYVPPEEAEANKWREQDPESVPGSVLLHLMAGLFTSLSLNSLTSKMELDTTSVNSTNLYYGETVAKRTSSPPHGTRHLKVKGNQEYVLW